MPAAYLICLVIVCIAVLEEVLLVLLFRPFRPVKASHVPKVTVMVAMRNEEDNVQRCLDGLLNQEFEGE